MFLKSDVKEVAYTNAENANVPEKVFFPAHLLF